MPHQSEEVVESTKEFANLTNLSDWSGSTNMFVLLTNGLVHFDEIFNLTDIGWFILTVALSTMSFSIQNFLLTSDRSSVRDW